MSVLEIEYLGDDLVISKETAEKELGLRPGDRLEIRPKVTLVPINRSPEELAKIRELLGAAAGSWSDEDVERFNALRKELWASWKQTEFV